MGSIEQPGRNSGQEPRCQGTQALPPANPSLALQRACTLAAVTQGTTPSLLRVRPAQRERQGEKGLVSGGEGNTVRTTTPQVTPSGSTHGTGAAFRHLRGRAIRSFERPPPRPLPPVESPFGPAKSPSRARQCQSSRQQTQRPGRIMGKVHDVSPLTPSAGPHTSAASTLIEGSCRWQRPDRPVAEDLEPAQWGRIRGSPKRWSALVSNRVIAAIRWPASVTTSRLVARNTSPVTSRE